LTVHNERDLEKDSKRDQAVDKEPEKHVEIDPDERWTSRQQQKQDPADALHQEKDKGEMSSEDAKTMGALLPADQVQQVEVVTQTKASAKAKVEPGARRLSFSMPQQEEKDRDFIAVDASLPVPEPKRGPKRVPCDKAFLNSITVCGHGRSSKV